MKGSNENVWNGSLGSMRGSFAYLEYGLVYRDDRKEGEVKCSPSRRSG